MTRRRFRGPELKVLREAKGYSQTEWGALIGLSQSEVCELEKLDGYVDDALVDIAVKIGPNPANPERKRRRKREKNRSSGPPATEQEAEPEQVGPEASVPTLHPSLEAAANAIAELARLIIQRMTPPPGDEAGPGPREAPGEVHIPPQWAAEPAKPGRLLPAGSIPLAILVNTPSPHVPHPLAMLRRRVFRQRPMLPADVPVQSTVPEVHIPSRRAAGPAEPQRLLPAGVIPLAVLVSRPSPPIPYPLVMFRRRVFKQRPMLPADVPAQSRVPARAARISGKGWRVRWSARAEQRMIAAVLALLIIGAAVIVLRSIRGHRDAPGSSIHAEGMQSEVDGQRKPLKAFKGQKQGPCDPSRGEHEIDNFCWWELNPADPCPPEAVKDNGRCLLPVPEGRRKSANEP